MEAGGPVGLFQLGERGVRAGAVFRLNLRPGEAQEAVRLQFADAGDVPPVQHGIVAALLRLADFGQLRVPFGFGGEHFHERRAGPLGFGGLLQLFEPLGQVRPQFDVARRQLDRGDICSAASRGCISAS